MLSKTPRGLVVLAPACTIEDDGAAGAVVVLVPLVDGKTAVDMVAVVGSVSGSAVAEKEDEDALRLADVDSALLMLLLAVVAAAVVVTLLATLLLEVLTGVVLSSLDVGVVVASLVLKVDEEDEVRIISLRDVPLDCSAVVSDVVEVTSD